jgi:hypothetical protein
VEDDSASHSRPSNRRPIQNRIQLTQISQGTGQDLEAGLAGKVEHPNQVVLIGNVFRTADLVARDIEREELPETGRLDLQHSFGVVGIIERQDVEAKAAADLLSGPNDLVGEVIPTESFQTMAFHVEDELFAEQRLAASRSAESIFLALRDSQGLPVADGATVFWGGSSMIRSRSGAASLSADWLRFMGVPQRLKFETSFPTRICSFDMPVQRFGAHLSNSSRNARGTENGKTGVRREKAWFADQKTSSPLEGEKR